MLHRGRHMNGSVATAEIGEVEVLTREDLAILFEQRTQTQGPIARLRDPHHMLARLIASGLKPNSEIARRSGYSVNRISMFMKDPTFVELVEHYRKEVTKEFLEGIDEYATLATSNMLKAERMLAEKLEALEENDETLPVRDLIAISRDAADRFGYGKKSTKDLNVNLDFASQLEKTIARSTSARRTIEHQPMKVVSPPLATNSLANAVTSPPSSITVRRRSLA